MSIHDETWDKCPFCKNVIKSWHGDMFHETAACTQFDTYQNFKTKLIECGFNLDLSYLPNADKNPLLKEALKIRKEMNIANKLGPNPETDKILCPEIYDQTANPDKCLIPTKQLEKSTDLPSFYGSSLESMAIGMQTHQPTYIQATEADWQNILDSLEFGFEITQEALADHDLRLGRTIKKNKLWAEELESEIGKFKMRIEFIKKLLGAC